MAFATVRRSIPVALAKPEIDIEGTSFKTESTAIMAWEKSILGEDIGEDIVGQSALIGPAIYTLLCTHYNVVITVSLSRIRNIIPRMIQSNHVLFDLTNCHIQ